jgi:hypothetical protein
MISVELADISDERMKVFNEVFRQSADVKARFASELRAREAPYAAENMEVKAAALTALKEHMWSKSTASLQKVVDTDRAVLNVSARSLDITRDALKSALQESA